MQKPREFENKMLYKKYLSYVTFRFKDILESNYMQYTVNNKVVHRSPGC